MEFQNAILRIHRAAKDDIIRAMEDNFLSYISAIPNVNNNILLDTDELLLISTGIIGRLILPCNEERAINIINLIKVHMPWLWCVGPRAKPDNLTFLLHDWVNDFV
jgi:hypothetical protein